VFVVVYFVIDSVRKLLDTPSYVLHKLQNVDMVSFKLSHYVRSFLCRPRQ